MRQPATMFSNSLDLGRPKDASVDEIFTYVSNIVFRCVDVSLCAYTPNRKILAAAVVHTRMHLEDVMDTLGDFSVGIIRIRKIHEAYCSSETRGRAREVARLQGYTRAALYDSIYKFQLTPDDFKDRSLSADDLIRRSPYVIERLRFLTCFVVTLKAHLEKGGNDPVEGAVGELQYD